MNEQSKQAISKNWNSKTNSIRRKFTPRQKQKPQKLAELPRTTGLVSGATSNQLSTRKSGLTRFPKIPKHFSIKLSDF